MQTEYKFTLKDMRDASRLYTKRRRFGRARYLLSIFGIPGLVFSLWLITRVFSGAKAASSSLPGVIFLIIFFCVVIPALREFTLRQRFSAMFPPGVPHVAQFSFDSEQIVSAIPGRSEGRIQWTTLVTFAEDQQLALFYLTKTTYVVVPKRAFPESVWAELRVLVERSIQTGK